MIYINDIPSFRNPESEVLKPDDRKERIELIGAVVVQDMGRVKSGDVLSLKCLFTRENYLRFEELWKSRAMVNYTDPLGVVWENVTIKWLEVERNRDFPEYIFVTFEVWRAGSIWQTNV